MYVPAYKYDDLRKIADGFLQKYHQSGTMPVPIEDIVELALKINVVPFPELLRHGVDAYVWKDLKTIVVDEFFYKKNIRRYRFTLAHELSHIILHKNVIQACPSDSIDAHKALMTAGNSRWLRSPRS